MNPLLPFLIAELIVIAVLIYFLAREKPTPEPVSGKPKLYFAQFEGAGISIEFDSEGNLTKMNLKAGKKLRAKVRYKDQFGNAAPIQSGSSRWESSDTSIATVTPDAEVPDADGNVFSSSALIESVGPVGAAQINATADGDSSAAEAPVNASGAVNVVPGNAVTSEIEFEEVAEDAGTGGTEAGTTGTETV